MVPGLERRCLGHDVRLDDVGGGPRPGTGRGRRSHGDRRGRRSGRGSTFVPQPATRRAARSPLVTKARAAGAHVAVMVVHGLRTLRHGRVACTPVETGSGAAARAYGSGTKRERTPAGSHDTRRPPATRGPPGRDRRRGDHRRVDPAPVGRLGTAAIEPRGRRGVPARRGRCRGGGDRVARAFARVGPDRVLVDRLAARVARSPRDLDGPQLDPRQRGSRRGTARPVDPAGHDGEPRGARDRRLLAGDLRRRRARPARRTRPPRSSLAHQGGLTRRRSPCRCTATSRCRVSPRCTT